MSNNQQNETNNEKQMLVHGSILAIAGVLTKIIGLIYRIPLLNIVGNEGMGYYNVAFSIYTMALMLTSYSLPLAVSKLVSARRAQRQYKNAQKVFIGALLFALVVGSITSLLIYIGAGFIAGTIMTMEMSKYALKVLAPCVLVVSFLGVFRGFFQGTGNMVPTAVSQVVEQIVNAIASVAGAYFLLQAGMEVAKNKSNDSYGPAYSAAGGTIGTVAGAFFGLLFLIFLYLLTRKRYKRECMHDHSKHVESYATVYKVLLLTIVPVILSATVYNIGDFLDSAIFNKIMAIQGYDDVYYASLLGMFGGQYSTLTNVPISIASALSTSMIPMLVAAVETGTRKQVHKRINLVTRFTMIIAFPSAAGLMVLAKPILDMLYYTQDNTIAAYMLEIGGISVVFYSLSTVTNAVLQGMDDMMTPVKNAAIALVIHVISLCLMMILFHWNIYAVVISKIIFALANSILNDHSMRDKFGYVQESRRTFIIPLIASVIMAVITLIVYLIGTVFIGSMISTIIAIVIAVIVYAASLIALGGITKEEMLELPKGTVLVRLFTKLHLLRG